MHALLARILMIQNTYLRQSMLQIIYFINQEPSNLQKKKRELESTFIGIINPKKSNIIVGCI